jgi:DNA repair ATPase RecN
MADLNQQLSQLEARVRNLNNAVTAHYLAMSTLVSALVADPFTTAPGSVGAFFYNHLPFGFQAMMDLIENGIPDFTSLIDELAAGLESEIEQTVEDVENQLESMIANQIEQINNMIQQYTDQINNYTAQITDLTNQINNLSPDDPALAALESQLTTAQGNLSKAQTNLTNAQGLMASFEAKAISTVKTTVSNFVLSQQKLKLGKSQGVDMSTGAL